MGIRIFNPFTTTLPALVFKQATGNYVTSGTSNAKAYTNSVVSGNLLICAVYSVGLLPVQGTVTDTLSTSWTKIAGSNNYVTMWWGVASLSGANTVTVTWTGSNPTEICISEYTVYGSAPTADGNGISASASPQTCSSSSASGSADLVVCFGANSSGNGVVLSAPSSGTLNGRTDGLGNPGNLFGGCALCDFTSAASGVQSFVNTATTSGTPESIIANFKANGTSANAVNIGG